MPDIEFSRVVSCSSEDKNFPAKNLLCPLNFKKWKSCPGENQAVVVLEMRKAERIDAMQIGNETSAFVEVQVGRSINTDEYEVLLPAMAFMSPKESHQLDHKNRVRMFSKAFLVPKVADQLWDRIKIVCTQPFNRSVGFGLSFVRLQSPEEDSAQIQSTSDGDVKLEKCVLKIDDATDNPTNSVDRFEQWRSTHQLSVTDVQKMHASEKVNLCEDVTSIPNVVDPQGSCTGVKKRKKSVPFNAIMDGVVIVLSGFIHPLRGDLREKAIKMGAAYRADWNNQCTHLICAFPNTPKFKKVHGKGLIVRKEWILDSFKERRKMPIRSYLFDPTGYMSSDEEIISCPTPTAGSSSSSNMPTSSNCAEDTGAPQP
uniref:BRCT domain-containing protein n=1 Tax=Trichuris muris TaxID=70415 RepID=A0A5S6QAC0_TRIMR